MKLFGLNSPEIFLITVIILSFLGTKRIEKGYLLFQNLLKFLLSTDNDINSKKAKEEEERRAEEERIALEKAKEEEQMIEADINSETPKEVN